MIIKRLMVLLATLLLALNVFAQDQSNTDTDIKIPLTVYQKLLKESKQPENIKNNQILEPKYTINQASYEGKINKEVATWSVKFQVDVFARSVMVPLLPNTVVIDNLKIDNQSATIFETDNKFSTKISEIGRHYITTQFQIAINQKQELPEILIDIPRVPINKIKLTLSGQKQIIIPHKTKIKYRYTKNKTIANLNIPISEQLHIQWSERLPASVQQSLRAYAEVYHSVSAQKGLMKASAIVELDVQKGKTKIISLVLPANAQIDQVDVPTGGLLDWTMVNANNEKQKILRIYLDRAINGKHALHIQYEKPLLQSSTDGHPFLVPLLRVLNMHKHKGMVSILSDPELLLHPVSTYNLYPVDQNQLPETILDKIDQPILHTYKYTAKYPKLHVKTETPTIVQSHFDTKIDSLFTFDTDRLEAKSIVDVNVTSGYIGEMKIEGAKDFKLLSVTGPGVNNYSLNEKKSSIDVTFNQAMRGQFKLAVEYEKRLTQDYKRLSIPTLYIRKSQNFSGNIAIVSLLTADLTALKSNKLTQVASHNLPQQLLLQTTNPIALAYTYAMNGADHNLELRISWHKELKLQDAVIENAQYQTLVTNDGLMVTKARFKLQNNFRQFLRIKLPKSSKIWSVYIDGNERNLNNVSMDKSQDPDTILISLNKAHTSLFVDMVYATPSERLDMYGAINMKLPVPDLLINQTNWDLYLPVGLEYYDIDTNMNILAQQRYSNPRSNTLSSNTSDASSLESIFDGDSDLTIPSQGIHYAFNRLYANQMQEPTRFRVFYASEFGYKMAERLSVVAVILIWIGLMALRFAKPPLNLSTAYTFLAIGIISLAFTLAFLHADSMIPTIVAVIGSLVYIYLLIMQQRRAALH